MPRKKDATPDDMLRAEREVGQNIPRAMVGLDTEDVGDVSTREELEREEADASKASRGEA